MRLKVQILRGALYCREIPRMHFSPPLSPLFFLRNYGELHNKSVMEEMELERIYFIIRYLDSFFGNSIFGTFL